MEDSGRESRDHRRIGSQETAEDRLVTGKLLFLSGKVCKFRDRRVFWETEIPAFFCVINLGETPPVIHLLAVVDGRPGHEKQTFGLIAALRRRCEIRVSTVRVERSIRGWVKNCAAFLLPALAEVPDGVQLVLCTGGKTHLQALACARKLKVPVCTCMTPGKGFRTLFDLCFVPEHDRIAFGKNIVTTLGAPTSCVDEGRHQPGRALLCVGGRNPWLIWQQELLLARIDEVLRREQRQWAVTDSPRTPQATTAALRGLCRQHDCTFFHWRETGRGWIEEQYATASEVWLTSDSISMVFEALSSGCRVRLFPMQWKSEDGKHAWNERVLAERGHVLLYPDWKRGRTLPGLPARLNEAQRCADIILEKWWPKN